MKNIVGFALCGLVLAAAPGLAAPSPDQTVQRHYSPVHRHFGIPIYGPNCRYSYSSPYCDYAFYRGPIFINGKWVYGGRFPHRYWHGYHQFWYQNGWHNGAWGRGGQWGGSGGYRSAR
jgi:hypothetical protein